MSECYEHEKLRRQGSVCPYCRIAELEAALKPFTHPDLRLRLGGNSPREGNEAVVFQRNSAKLRLKDFDGAQEVLIGWGSL
jgi:hypothetical protein